MKLKVLWTLLEESESLGPVYCALLVQAAELRRRCCGDGGGRFYFSITTYRAAEGDLDAVQRLRRWILRA